MNYQLDIKFNKDILPKEEHEEALNISLQIATTAIKEGFIAGEIYYHTKSNTIIDGWWELKQITENH